MGPFPHKAIAVTVILQQALGFSWYSSWLFGAQWMAAVGRKTGELNPRNPIPFAVAILASVLFCYLLSWLIQRTQIASPVAGAALGVAVWLGFVAPALAAHYLFIGLPWTLIGIDGGATFVNALLAGVILAAWRRR